MSGCYWASTFPSKEEDSEVMRFAFWRKGGMENDVTVYHSDFLLQSISLPSSVFHLIPCWFLSHQLPDVWRVYVLTSAAPLTCQLLCGRGSRGPLHKGSLIPETPKCTNLARELFSLQSKTKMHVESKVRGQVKRNKALSHTHEAAHRPLLWTPPTSGLHTAGAYSIPRASR